MYTHRMYMYVHKYNMVIMMDAQEHTISSRFASDFIADIGRPSADIDTSAQGGILTRQSPKDAFYKEGIECSTVAADFYPVRAGQQVGFIYDPLTRAAQVQHLENLSRGFGRIVFLNLGAGEALLQPLDGNTRAAVYFNDSNLVHVQRTNHLSSNPFYLLRPGDMLQYALMQDSTHALPQQDHGGTTCRAVRIELYHNYDFSLGEQHFMLGIVVNVEQETESSDAVIALCSGMGPVHVGCAKCGRGAELKGQTGVRIQMRVRRFDRGLHNPCIDGTHGVGLYCDEYHVCNDVLLGPSEEASLCTVDCDHEGIALSPLFPYELAENLSDAKRAVVTMVSANHGTAYCSGILKSRVFFHRKALMCELPADQPLLQSLGAGTLLEVHLKHSETALKRHGTVFAVKHAERTKPDPVWAAKSTCLPPGLFEDEGVIVACHKSLFKGCIRLKTSSVLVYFTGSELPFPKSDLPFLLRTGRSTTVTYAACQDRHCRTQFMVQSFVPIQLTALMQPPPLEYEKYHDCLSPPPPPPASPVRPLRRNHWRSMHNVYRPPQTSRFHSTAQLNRPMSAFNNRSRSSSNIRSMSSFDSRPKRGFASETPDPLQKTGRGGFSRSRTEETRAVSSAPSRGGFSRLQREDTSVHESHDSGLERSMDSNELDCNSSASALTSTQSCIGGLDKCGASASRGGFSRVGHAPLRSSQSMNVFDASPGRTAEKRCDDSEGLSVKAKSEAELYCMELQEGGASTCAPAKSHSSLLQKVLKPKKVCFVKTDTLIEVRIKKSKNP